MAGNIEAESQTGRAGKRFSVDLDAMSVAELIALRDAAESKRQEKLEDAKASILARARSELEALGLSLEISVAGSTAPPGATGKKPNRPQGGLVEVKFRGPNGETWSGRGRLPRWLHAIEAQGGSRSQYAVKSE